MDTILGTFTVMAGIVAVSWVLSRLMEGDSIFPKPYLIEDFDGVIKLGIGFVSAILLLAATGIFGYDFAVVYVRVATTIVMLALIYSLLRYRFRPSLLLLGVITTLVLFNPFKPVTMERSQWIVVDLAVAVVLPLLAYRYITYHTKREEMIAEARAVEYRKKKTT